MKNLYCGWVIIQGLRSCPGASDKIQNTGVWQYCLNSLWTVEPHIVSWQLPRMFRARSEHWAQPTMTPRIKNNKRPIHALHATIPALISRTTCSSKHYWYIPECHVVSWILPQVVWFRKTLTQKLEFKQQGFPGSEHWISSPVSGELSGTDLGFWTFYRRFPP